MADITLTFKAAVQQAVKEIEKLKGGLEKLDKSGVGQAVKGLTGFSLTSIGATGAVIAAGKAVQQAIGDWSAYAEQMDKSSKLAGISVEDMSRLTQAADDFRVSQESLTTVMGIALKNGFVPTIENLADLSDRFIAIEDPEKRAAMANEVFGRGWKEIAPLLLKGGDAIRSGTAAIADNLVVTDEAVQKNNEYIKAMDDLDDAMTGVKNNMAQGVIPSWTKFIELLNTPNAHSAAALVDQIFRGTALESDVLAAQRAAVSLAEGVAADTNELIKLKAAAEETAPPVDFLADATNNADAAMRSYSDALLFSIARQGLSEEAALALAQRMGLVDEKTVLATEKTKEYQRMLDEGRISIDTYNALVSGLADSLDRLEDKTITVTYNQVTTGTAPSGAWQATGGEGSTQTNRASGGPTWPGMYISDWMTTAGQKEVLIQDNGYVLTEQKAKDALANSRGGRPVNITNNIYNNLDMAEVTAQTMEIARRER